MVDILKFFVEVGRGGRGGGSCGIGVGGVWDRGVGRGISICLILSLHFYTVLT